MMSAPNETMEADEAIADAYRRQARQCLAATRAVLDGGWHQAAALLAVQAVRTGANALLASRVGIAASGQGADPIDLLYRRLPALRRDPLLAVGAEVIAYEEDLQYFGLELEPAEARRLVALADQFCAWAV